MAVDNKKIYSLLLGRIESGVYPPGAKMPTGRELAKELEVTHWVVHSTMLALEEDGFVESRPPVGVFVRSNVAMDKVRRHKNCFSKNVSILASRSFFYVVHGYEDIIGDLERRLEAKDIRVVYDNMPETANTMERFLESAAAAGTKALVVFPEQREWDLLHRHKNVFMRHPVNVFYFNRGLGPGDTLPFHGVGVDTHGGGALAARWVLERKIESVAYLTYDSFSDYWVTTRHQGFRGEMERASHPYQLFATPTPEQAMKLALDFVQASPAPPALVVCNDPWAAPLHDNLASHGLEAGKDYHMVSFDCLPSCRNYKFVNVAWPLDKVGGLLADAIDNPDIAKNQDLFSLKYQLKPFIIDRTLK